MGSSVLQREKLEVALLVEFVKQFPKKVAACEVFFKIGHFLNDYSLTHL